MKRYIVINEFYAGVEQCKSHKDAQLKALFLNANHAGGKDDFQVVRFVDEFHANPNGISPNFYDTKEEFEAAFKAFSEDSAAIANQQARQYYAWGKRKFPDYKVIEGTGNPLP